MAPFLTNIDARALVIGDQGLTLIDRATGHLTGLPQVERDFKGREKQILIVRSFFL